jgi:transposase
MTRLSAIQRSRVIQLFNEGKSQAEIVRQTNFSREFVKRWVAAAEDGRGPADQPRPGSPRKLSQTDRVTIRAMLKGKQGRSTRKVAALFTARKHKAVSRESIRSVAKQAGLKPYVRSSKPLLTEGHRHRRLEFVELYQNINWRQVLFTDETTFTLFGRPNRKVDIIWEENRDDVPVASTVKHAAKLHVWGGVSFYGKTDLYLFTDNLDSDLYIKILSARVGQAEAMFPGGVWMLQQDGDPKHTSKKSIKWLEDNVPSFIPKEHWPANSPDLNPIEHIWQLLKNQVYGREPRTIDALKRIIREEWNKLDFQLLHKLVDSMHRRFAAVVANQGGPTKY